MNCRTGLYVADITSITAVPISFSPERYLVVFYYQEQQIVASGQEEQCRVGMWRGSLGVACLFSAPFVWRCLNSHSMPRFHIPLVEPDVRISRIRLSDGRRLQAHAARAARTASPETQACSGVASSSSKGGYRLAPLSRPLSPSQAHPKSGPFPPPALPGITGTTSLSATPSGPACPSRASGW